MVIPEGTVCELCGKVKEGKKQYHRHHIDYDKDVVIMLCYTCHSLVHGRLRWGNSWDARYGKDKGFYELAKAFIAIYESICMECGKPWDSEYHSSDQCVKGDI